MWTAFEMMIVQLVMMLLSAVVKNPASAAKERKVIAQLAQLATEADTLASPGTSWTYAPPTVFPAPVIAPFPATAPFPTPLPTPTPAPAPVVAPPTPTPAPAAAPGGDIFHPQS